MKYYNILMLKALIWEVKGLNIYKGYIIFMHTHETILIFEGRVPCVAIHKLIVKRLRRSLEAPKFDLWHIA